MIIIETGYKTKLTLAAVTKLIFLPRNERSAFKCKTTKPFSEQILKINLKLFLAYFQANQKKKRNQLHHHPGVPLKYSSSAHIFLFTADPKVRWSQYRQHSDLSQYVLYNISRPPWTSVCVQQWQWNFIFFGKKVADSNVNLIVCYHDDQGGDETSQCHKFVYF